MDEKRVLLHACCGPCSTIAIERLISDGFKPVLFYYNPNIAPYSEYKKRLENLRLVADHFKIDLIIPFETEQEYLEEHSRWRDSVKGYEDEPEEGKRCSICYAYRLKKASEFAKKNKFDKYSTTLTTGTAKKACIINPIGKSFETDKEKQKNQFLEYDFKKKDGFLRSVRISKELGLYRQDYCGCEFSLRDRILYKRAKEKSNQ